MWRASGSSWGEQPGGGKLPLEPAAPGAGHGDGEAPDAVAFLRASRREARCGCRALPGRCAARAARGALKPRAGGAAERRAARGCAAAAALPRGARCGLSAAGVGSRSVTPPVRIIAREWRSSARSVELVPCAVGCQFSLFLLIASRFAGGFCPSPMSPCRAGSKKTAGKLLNWGGFDADVE